MPHPSWLASKSKYPIGARLEGVIKKVWQFGILVELEPGVTGLIRNKELSWEQPVVDATTFFHENQLLTIDRRIPVSVLGYTSSRGDILLSLRRAIYDPWDHQGERYRLGAVVQGTIAMISRGYALIDLADCQHTACLTARLPREEIVPWPIDSIEDILERGDTIEVIITSRHEETRVIIVSMRQRFEQIGRELGGPADEPVWMPQTPLVKAAAEVDDSGNDAGMVRRKIERVLLIDDDEDQYLHLEGYLDELGIEDVMYSEDFEKGRFLATTESFDLILMDVKGKGNPTAGLDAAELILADKPDALVVLVTGDENVLVDERAQSIAMSTAGIILKPVTFAVLADAISRLERLGHAGWPGRLVERAQDAPRFGKGISQTGSLRRPLREVIEEVLGEVADDTWSNRAAVFSMDPRTSRVEMVAGIGIAPSEIQRHKTKLPKSPVNDIIYEGEEIHENQVERMEGKYRNLLRVFSFNACIGTKVPRTAGDLGYGLFLFRSDQQDFTDSDVKLAHAAAAVIGLAIREQWLVHQVAADQRLTLIGSTIASVGHELRNRLGDVEAVVPLERAWQEVKRNPARLNDAAFITIRIERNLDRLKAARLGLSPLADILLGAAADRPEQVFDVNACVRMAIALVAQEARQAKITCHSDLTPGMLLARGNALELQQVFLNVLLNAIQQMPRAHRKRGRVVVTTRADASDPHRPVVVQVSDSGPGIHAKDIEKIFEPMVTTKRQGTGLGLYICRDLLSTMDGTIEVEKTAILVGTTFLIRLPAPARER